MKSMRCIHKWATAIVALGLAASVAPVTRAQAQSESSGAAAPSATASSSTDTQKRLDELQKEFTELRTQIAALKAAQQSAPEMKTAAMTTAASPAASEPVATPAADDAPAKITLAGLLGPTTISGLVDGYYEFDNNHPIDNTAGFRYFEGNTNAFSLSMAEIGVAKAPDASSMEARFGYHVVGAYGESAYNVNIFDPATDGSNFFFEQAYGSYLAPIGKGLQIDVGKFVTPIGGEVIESSGDWNYSRGILFYYAIPLFHVGARATYAFNSKWAVAGYLVDGWNNSIICHECTFGSNVGGSAGLTYIGSVTWTPTAKWSIIQNYTGGPVIGAYQANLKSINDWKQLSDTVISYTPNSKWAFMLNGDYGFGPRYYDAVIAPTSSSPSVKWGGVAGYAKYRLTPKSYAAVRYEYYDDPDGYTGLVGGDDGHAQEVTGTYSYNLTSGLQVRGEYRYDLASEPFFLAGANALKQTQNTVTLGFVYSFSSVNAK
ncbi:MAG: porin [Candidatus Acidiferrales bacterium]